MTAHSMEQQKALCVVLILIQSIHELHMENKGEMVPEEKRKQRIATEKKYEDKALPSYLPGPTHSGP